MTRSKKIMAVADQEELNYWVSDSVSDADLLQAVESIESAQASIDQAVQTSTAFYVIHTTARVESVGRAETVAASEPPQISKFYTDCTFIICIPASPADIGRKSTSRGQDFGATRLDPTQPNLIRPTGPSDPWTSLNWRYT